MNPEISKRKAGQKTPGDVALLVPKASARELHQSRALKNQNPQNGQHRARFDWGFGAVYSGASPSHRPAYLRRGRESPTDRSQTTMAFLPEGPNRTFLFGVDKTRDWFDSSVCGE